MTTVAEVSAAGSRVQASHQTGGFDEDYLRGMARAVLRRVSDAAPEVRSSASHVAEHIGDAYAWHALLQAVRRARMSASVESAIRACIQEING